MANVLGHGGFGITYRAYDLQLRREVAIKEYLPTAFARRHGGITVVPHSTRTADDFLWGRTRFLDEARTLAHFESAPGVVNVFDFLEANGTAYMVMALVVGETLDAHLKRDHGLSQLAIDSLLYPLLDGLERVHGAGFLHRDIKPANILIDAGGRPTLIDFGACRAALQDRTQAITAIYTPGYAAPEQMTAGKQGPWTDIYALAGTLYHCITGRMPPSAIERATGDELVSAVDAGDGRYAPNLLIAIDAGLALKPSERPQSIAEWRQILYGRTSGAGGSLRVAATRVLNESTPNADRAAPNSSSRGRRRYWLGSIAASVIALAVGGGWLMLGGESADRTLRPAETGAKRQTAVEPTARPDDAERQRLAAEAARRKADEDQAREVAMRQAAVEAEAKRKAQEEAAAVAAAEARRRAEQQARAEAVAREKAEAEIRAREDMMRREQEEAARKAAEEKERADSETKRHAESAEAALRLSEQDRKRVQVALTALGHDTQGVDGSFGRRTRQMIAAWQRTQGAAETGHLTAPQLSVLRQQAAAALTRYDEEQRKIEEEKRKAEDDAKARAEAAAAAPRRDERTSRALQWSTGQRAQFMNECVPGCQSSPKVHPSRRGECRAYCECFALEAEAINPNYAALERELGGGIETEIVRRFKAVAPMCNRRVFGE
ncbi:MAG TPA: serine/threonine-protein kinase [Vineibacter sp.]|nr:serine/threonine-protein kinase [Vineibacter sp.]